MGRPTQFVCFKSTDHIPLAGDPAAAVGKTPAAASAKSVVGRHTQNGGRREPDPFPNQCTPLCIHAGATTPRRTIVTLCCRSHLCAKARDAGCGRRRLTPHPPTAQQPTAIADLRTRVRHSSSGSGPNPTMVQKAADPTVPQQLQGFAKELLEKVSACVCVRGDGEGCGWPDGVGMACVLGA